MKGFVLPVRTSGKSQKYESTAIAFDSSEKIQEAFTRPPQIDSIEARSL